ncbi:SDR family NAD(P)-dependent oxidoreductase [Streptomyces sp. NPDC054995]
MRRLEGKVALVSGTARGLGRATALMFAAEGALVVVGDLLHDEAVETQRQIARDGGTALTPGPLDVTSPESVAAWVEEAAAAFGGVDIVLVNAGSVWFGPLADQSYDDGPATVRAELDSVRLTARAAWQHLVRSRGCIITVDSAAGLTDSMATHRTTHSAAKGEVAALNRRLAAEGAELGIRANCVSPVLIGSDRSRSHLPSEAFRLHDTTWHLPLGRLGLPQDVAAAAVFLASEDASNISGTNLVVDGAWSPVLPGSPA